MKLWHRFLITLWKQRWLPHRQLRFLYKGHVPLEIAECFGFDVPFYGMRYRGTLGNTIDEHVFYYGAFEKPMLCFLRDALAARCPDGGAVAIDAGANVGHHTLFMSLLVQQVHAFEPYGPVRSRCESLLRINGVSNVQVHPVGLGDKEAELAFYAPDGHNFGVGTFAPAGDVTARLPAETLRVVRGDDYLRSAGVKRVDLIKMDVEGFEKLALQGLAETLRSSRPLLVVELTYGSSLSFANEAELRQTLGDGYELFMFDWRDADGAKSRRHQGRARRTGAYRLVPFRFGEADSQDDVIACPSEFVPSLPMELAQSRRG